MTLTCNQLSLLANFRRGTPPELNGCYFSDLESLVKWGLVATKLAGYPQTTAMGEAYIQKCLMLSHEIQHVFS
jgi:hypothetical protein